MLVQECESNGVLLFWLNDVVKFVKATINAPLVCLLAGTQLFMDTFLKIELSRCLWVIFINQSGVRQNRICIFWGGDCWFWCTYLRAFLGEHYVRFLWPWTWLSSSHWLLCFLAFPCIFIQPSATFPILRDGAEGETGKSLSVGGLKLAKYSEVG